jgi:hypothetical protein
LFFYNAPAFYVPDHCQKCKEHFSNFIYCDTILVESSLMMSGKCQLIKMG